MIYLEEQEDKNKSFFDFLYVVFLRVMSMIMLGITLYYWLRMIGYYQGDDYQFSTMSPLWKVTALTMGVFAPVAAVGLWVLSAWGTVVLIMLSFVNLVLFSGMVIFGFHFIFFFIFLAALLGLIFFHGIFWLRNRSRAASK